jgi:hypothetical protein
MNQSRQVWMVLLFFGPTPIALLASLALWLWRLVFHG